jgi:hypothetical protein
VNTPCTIIVDHQQVNGSGTNFIYQNSNPSNTYQVYGDGCLTQYYLDDCVGAPDYGELSIDLGEAVAEAKTACLNNIDKTPYSFGQDIGELAETIAFLRDPLKSLKNVSNLYRRAVKYGSLLKGRRIALTAKRTADIYLEYSLAAAPLFRSICNFYDALHEEPYQPKRQTARGHVKLDKSIPTHTQSIQYYGGNTVTFNVSTIVERTVRAGFLYEVENPAIGVWYKYGLRVKDIPETVWQVMPLSFMVDRLVGISDSIRGFTNLTDPSINSLAGWLTIKENTIKTTSVVHISESGYTSSVLPDLLFQKAFTYTRDVWEPGYLDTIPLLHYGDIIKDAHSTADLLGLIVSNFAPVTRDIILRRI